MYYFDNAATTKNKPEKVIEAVINAMKTAGNASRGVYNESLSSDRIIYSARNSICKLFNADNPRQVVFTKNSTEALNIAIMGILTPSDHVITTEMEHNSVLRPLNYLKLEGLKVDYIPMDEKGNLKYECIEDFINDDTKTIIINHSSNVIGNINDLKKIGDLCLKHKLIFIVDASQTAGSFKIDMKEMSIDVLCFTGHKSLLGPQGTGGLCVSEKIEIKPFIVGGTGVQTYNEYQPDEMPTRLEAGTLNTHGIAGLIAGIEYINDNGMENLTRKSQELAKYFYESIKNFPGIKLYGDYSDHYLRSPIVTFNIMDSDSSEISMILSDEYGISTRPGAHCAPLLHKSFGTVDQGMVRFSFSHSNTKEEIEVAINAIKNIIDEIGGK